MVIISTILIVSMFSSMGVAIYYSGKLNGVKEATVIHDEAKGEMVKLYENHIKEIVKIYDNRIKEMEIIYKNHIDRLKG